MGNTKIAIDMDVNSIKVLGGLQWHYYGQKT